MQGNRDIAQCDHKTRLECIENELIKPREKAVSYQDCTLNLAPILATSLNTSTFRPDKDDWTKPENLLALELNTFGMSKLLNGLVIHVAPSTGHLLLCHNNCSGLR